MTQSPLNAVNSRQEAQYFFLNDQKLIIEQHNAEDEARRLEEAAQKRQLHWMKCPKCGEPLQERSFQKIQIDQCTGCNGIWLDPGELEQVAKKENDSWLGKFWQKNG